MRSSRPLLIVGAGIAGVTSALEAAEAGQEIILIDRDWTVGGRVKQIHHYFPKLCPPSCGLEINIQRLKKNPRIRAIMGATVEEAKATKWGWTVALRKAPRLVNARCTACGDCTEVCPARVPDPFNLGMCEVPAIRLPHLDAWPHRFVLDREACIEGCQACAEACKYGAIDLNAAASREVLEVGAVVIATGWKPYPKERLPELGGGLHADVISNIEMERLAAPAGPTGGKILRPSDNTPPKRVAFIQCAGSRDHKHLPYCSAVCCLASLKHALYIREQLPETEVTIYYIDRRTPGRNEDFLTRVAATEGVKLVKGKVGKIGMANGSLTLRAEDVEADRLIEDTADLVVLATGMVSSLEGDELPFPLVTDDDGFGLDAAERRLFVAGVARRPEDVAATVRDGTGAAAKAIAAGKQPTLTGQ